VTPHYKRFIDISMGALGSLDVGTSAPLIQLIRSMHTCLSVSLAMLCLTRLPMYRSKRMLPHQSSLWMESVGWEVGKLVIHSHVKKVQIN